MPPAQEIQPPPNKRITRHLPTVARLVMGLPLIIFGFNCFLNFIPPPPTPLPDKALAFAGALVNSGYMMPLIGVTQLVVGIFLVTNRFVPLGLVLLAPFIVNSMAFHLFLEHGGLPMASVFLVLELYLAWIHRNAYRPLLTARVAHL